MEITFHPDGLLWSIGIIATATTVFSGIVWGETDSTPAGIVATIGMILAVACIVIGFSFTFS